MTLAIRLAEQRHVPDAVIRLGIRWLVRQTLRREEAGGDARQAAVRQKLATAMLAECTEQANDQHYELPIAFFEQVLGRHLKYSAGYWPEPHTTLDESEEVSLQRVAKRAGLQDGMKVLDLGCGWGAFALWAARHYPGSRITALSNSTRQCEFIQHQARERGLENIEVFTADINTFTTHERFDRIISIEMMEHVRNHADLFKRLASWINTEGRVFVHVFSHIRYTYLFDAIHDEDWMERHFFSGGIMPAHDLFTAYDDDIIIEKSWRLDGTHYERTLNAWLARMDQHRDRLLAVFEDRYGGDAALWMQRWRIFFMASAELFGYRHGSEWGVSQYLFCKRP